MEPTSYLYVPGDRPDRFGKAVGSGARAVVFDLEDAVSVGAKDMARASVAEHLAHPAPSGVEQWVRINAGAAGLDDLAAVGTRAGVTGVFVPKATREVLERVATITALPCCALVETAPAVLDVAGLAAAGNVVALAMGEVDLVADLGLEPSGDEHELWPFRMQVVAASAAAGRRPPIGGVFTDIADLDGLRRTTRALRRAGFESRQAVHPTQVEVIDGVMAPTAEEVERAHTVLRLAEEAGGGVWVDNEGRMVDEAVLRRARRVLARRSSI